MNVDYVVVSSEAGCGKSLTIHKCAYAYYKQGWSIYKFNHIDIDGVFNVPPLINNDKELLIVDDAQKVPEYKLLNLVSQSNNNCKIILAFTDTTSSIELFREPIRMTKKDAVNNMYSFYLQNKKDIFPIVKNINKDIGNQSMSISYEKILEECKKQDRPWMFNYVLRGGWKTEKENYQSVYHINHMSFLVASIAFNQIVLLDECSDLDSINKFYEKDKIKWSTKNLEILIKKKIIISIDELRIIHLKSAINLLYSFYMCSTLDEKKLFAEYMIDFLNSNNISFQGLLWLFNMSFNYDNLKYYLFNHDVINYCLSHMLNTTEDIEKGFYLYLLERIEIINKQRVKKFIEDNLECFSSWLSSPSDKTVYCFSQFVNGIINMRDDTIYRLKEFINFEKIYNCFKKSDPNYFYSWCVFFNRIVFSIKNEKARKEYSESLYVIIENINSVPIVSFICGLAELIHFDEKFLELIPLRKDELKNAFINNFNDSLDVFRGDAPLTIFGYSSIGKIDITEIRKKASNTILDLIPIEQFANYISNSEPRDWLTIESIGRILYKYERIEYKEIVETIDFNKLSKASQDLWENSSHDLIYLIVFLGMGDAKLTSDFILNNLHLIKKMDLMILSYIPDKISSCIENGISVELFSGYNTGLLYDVLLYYLETKSLKKVLLLTKNDFINKVKDLCILDFERYEVGNDKIFNDVLSLIENENEEFLNDSFSYIDDNLLLEIKRKMDNDNRLNNDIKKNFNYFINLFSKYTKRDMRKMIYQINDK